MLKPLLNQPVTTIIEWGGSLYLIFLFWWWFCFFYSTLYSSSLFTTFLKNDMTSKNLLQLIENGFRFEVITCFVQFTVKIIIIDIFDSTDLIIKGSKYPKFNYLMYFELNRNEKL